MNRSIVLIFITMTFLVLLCFSLFPNDGCIAQAQEKKFLADVHAGKGMNCASCHKESPPKEKVPTDACVKCHGDYDKLAEKTAKIEPNPHKSHLGNLDCEFCHHAHKPQENFCTQCHAGFTFKSK